MLLRIYSTGCRSKRSVGRQPGGINHSMVVMKRAMFGIPPMLMLIRRRWMYSLSTRLEQLLWLGKPRAPLLCHWREADSFTGSVKRSLWKVTDNRRWLQEPEFARKGPEAKDKLKLSPASDQRPHGGWRSSVDNTEVGQLNDPSIGAASPREEVKIKVTSGFLTPKVESWKSLKGSRNLAWSRAIDCRLPLYVQPTRGLPGKLGHSSGSRRDSPERPRYHGIRWTAFLNDVRDDGGTEREFDFISCWFYCESDG
ncbi:hypothetical protein RRG08_046422 [Elysia crispata]|uniref:Uncharacterized protein n=1 Tax=Elysia crispata TaxID=231223 RepID=A0AAE0Z8K9_9GAST|nr:hypothetical protein RRG08_046422 [Elysia crispata]